MMYIRVRFCELLVSAASKAPYVGDDDDTSAAAVVLPAKDTPLQKWDADLWYDFLDDFSKIKSLLRRQDATAVLVGGKKHRRSDLAKKNGRKKVYPMGYQPPPGKSSSGGGRDGSTGDNDVVESLRSKIVRALAMVHRVLAPIKDVLEIIEAEEGGDDYLMGRKFRDEAERIQQVG